MQNIVHQNALQEKSDKIKQTLNNQSVHEHWQQNERIYNKS